MGDRGKWKSRAAGHGGSSTVKITEGERDRDTERGLKKNRGLMGNIAALKCWTISTLGV